MQVSDEMHVAIQAATKRLRRAETNFWDAGMYYANDPTDYQRRKLNQARLALEQAIMELKELVESAQTPDWP